MRSRDLSPALIASTCLLTVRRGPEPLPQHERETRAAWQALQEGKLQDAIRHADICIREFRGAAARKQASLAGAGVIVPVGVVDERRMKSIFANGPLNDVATCYYIKGRAAHAMGQVHVAAKVAHRGHEVSDGQGLGREGLVLVARRGGAAIPRGSDGPGQGTPRGLYTGDAWAAFGRRDHAQVQAIADKCIEQFQPRAIEIQKSISVRGDRPPDGEVSESVRKKSSRTASSTTSPPACSSKASPRRRWGTTSHCRNAYRGGDAPGPRPGLG